MKQAQTIIALVVIFSLISFIEMNTNVFEWGKTWKVILSIFVLLGGFKIYDDFMKVKRIKSAVKRRKLHEQLSIETYFIAEDLAYMQTVLKLSNNGLIALALLASSEGKEATEIVAEVQSFELKQNEKKRQN